MKLNRGLLELLLENKEFEKNKVIIQAENSTLYIQNRNVHRFDHIERCHRISVNDRYNDLIRNRKNFADIADSVIELKNVTYRSAQ